jgi:hypothetical protein
MMIPDCILLIPFTAFGWDAMCAHFLGGGISVYWGRFLFTGLFLFCFCFFCWLLARYPSRRCCHLRGFVFFCDALLFTY